MGFAKVLMFMLVSVLTFSSVYSTTITTPSGSIYTIEEEYGTKNMLLMTYLGAAFIFWLFIYFKLPEFKWNKKNLLKSLFVMISRGVTWIWFIGLFYMLSGILFISSSETFLDDKLYIINTLLLITIIVYSIFILLFTIKIYSNASGLSQFFKDLVWEVRKGGD